MDVGGPKGVIASIKMNSDSGEQDNRLQLKRNSRPESGRLVKRFLNCLNFDCKIKDRNIPIGIAWPIQNCLIG